MLAEYARRRRRIVDGRNAIQASLAVSRRRVLRVSQRFRALGNGRMRSQNTALSLLRCCSKKLTSSCARKAFGAPGYLRLPNGNFIERDEEGLRRIGKFFARAASAA